MDEAHWTILTLQCGILVGDDAIQKIASVVPKCVGCSDLLNFRIMAEGAL